MNYMEVIGMAKEQISIRIPGETLERLDEIARLTDMDRSKLIVNILDEVSKSILATKKVGFLQFAVLLRDMGEWLDKWVDSIKKKKSIDDFIVK
jgi:hypothetical protein